MGRMVGGRRRGDSSLVLRGRAGLLHSWTVAMLMWIGFFSSNCNALVPSLVTAPRPFSGCGPATSQRWAGSAVGAFSRSSCRQVALDCKPQGKEDQQVSIGASDVNQAVSDEDQSPYTLYSFPTAYWPFLAWLLACAFVYAWDFSLPADMDNFPI